MNWMRIAPYLLSIAAVIGLLWGVFSLGSSHGEAMVRAEWQKQKDADAKLAAKEKARIDSEVLTHRTKDKEISDELAKIKATSAADIARIHGDATIRLRDSEQRTALYRAASEGGEAQRANFASYAAQLDRSLAEGIGLVDELRTTLEVRDGQIKALGAQIVNDRQLIAGSNDSDGSSD